MENIEENNALIAEFMKLDDVSKGHWKKVGDPGHEKWIWIDKGTYWPILRYHESWEWLMDVVEKIENEIGHAVRICQEDVTIYEHDNKSSLDDIIEVHHTTKIEAVYQAVVDFIKWYNKQSK